MDRKRNKDSRAELIHRARVIKSQLIDLYVQEKTAKLLYKCVVYNGVTSKLCDKNH